MEFLVKAGEKQYKVLNVSDTGVLVSEAGTGKMQFVSKEHFVATYNYWFTADITVNMKEKRTG